MGSGSKDLSTDLGHKTKPSPILSLSLLLSCSLSLTLSLSLALSLFLGFIGKKKKEGTLLNSF